MITFFLIKIGLLSISKKQILKWIESKDYDKLNFVIKKGNYKSRIILVDSINDFIDKDFIPILMIGLKDKIEIISKTSINKLRRFNLNDVQKKELSTRENDWNVKVIISKTSNKRHSSIDNIVNQKGKMRNLERLKQQLKKGINTGK